MSTEGVDGDVIEILNTFEYVEKNPGWQIAIFVDLGIVLIFFGLALYPTKRVETQYKCAIDDTTSFMPCSARHQYR